MTPPQPVTGQQIADALRDPNSDPHHTWAMWQTLHPPAFTIKLDRTGDLWGWTVFRGSEVAAISVLPRLTERAARRSAERAMRRARKDTRPLEVRYTP